MWHYSWNEEADKKLPIWDAFVEASYIINRDFTITAPLLGNFNFSMGHIKLSEELGIWGNLSEYHTHFGGTCYKIQTNISIKPVKAFILILEFNESLNQADIPPVSIYCRGWVKKVDKPET